MRQGLRSKEEFYHHMGQSLRSGIPFPKALESLESLGCGGALTKKLRGAIAKGNNISDAFSAELVSPMERSVIAACNQSGRLEDACAYLSEYYGRLRLLRSMLLRKFAYPLFLLHFGVLALNTSLLIKDGTRAYLEQTTGILLIFYVFAGAIWMVSELLRKTAQQSPAMDRFLCTIPILGALRKKFAVQRFCATYELQLSAGMNLFQSLEGAAEASQSSQIKQLVHEILPQVRAGQQVGPLLHASGIFPANITRAFCLAEETGQLDAELKRICEALETKIGAGVEILATWLPKLLYLAIVLYLAWQIFETVNSVSSELNKLMEP